MEVGARRGAHFQQGNSVINEKRLLLLCLWIASPGIASGSARQLIKSTK